MARRRQRERPADRATASRDGRSRRRRRSARSRLPATSCSLAGGDDGRLVAWDVTGGKPLAELAVGAAVRAIAIDGEVARGAAGSIAIGTADGALHVIRFAIAGGTPTLARPRPPRALRRRDRRGVLRSRRARARRRRRRSAVDRRQRRRTACRLAGRRRRRSARWSRSAMAALRSGAATARCACASSSATSRRSIAPAITVTPARCAASCSGRSSPTSAGRDQPRRMFSCGEDGAVKSWLVDGARRPETIEPTSRPAGGDRAARRRRYPTASAGCGSPATIGASPRSRCLADAEPG